MSFITQKIHDNNIIGIDLGTTNTLSSILVNKQPIIIKTPHNDSITPSIVNQKDKTNFIIGNEAKKLLKHDPANTIFSSKRLIGRKFNEVKDYISKLPYKTVESCNGDVWIKTDFSKFSPTEVASKILKYVKDYSEQFLKIYRDTNNSIQRAVITVPAYFNDSQKQATKDAGRIAGLDIVRIINEPTAAALAYGLEKDIKGNIAVYDLGGGTFDISILEIDNGVFHVKSINGNTFLGGEDFDSEFVKFLINIFKEKEGIEIVDSNGLVKLRLAAENAKKELSVKDTTQIYIENIIDGVDFDVTITKSQLESIIKKIANKTIEPCEQAIKDAGIKKKDIDKVILVGGMTKMPYIKKLVHTIFNKEPLCNINPDEVVAKGAAIQAGIISGDINNAVLLDVIPLSLGIETVGGVFNKIVNKNTTIPFKQEETFTTSEDNQTEVDIRIYQGEKPFAIDNKNLGKITLTNIPPMKKGIPKIKVIFSADNNGLLKVYAEDDITKKQHELQIKAVSELTNSEINNLIANNNK